MKSFKQYITSESLNIKTHDDDFTYSEPGNFSSDKFKLFSDDPDIDAPLRPSRGRHIGPFIPPKDTPKYEGPYDLDKKD